MCALPEETVRNFVTFQPAIPRAALVISRIIVVNRRDTMNNYAKMLCGYPVYSWLQMRLLD